MALQKATGERQRGTPGDAREGAPVASSSGRLQLQTLFVIALSALAWAALWLWGHSPSGHHGDSGPAIAWLVSWIVMVIAMMLPTTLPLLAGLPRPTSVRRSVARLILLLAGYLCAWTLFGVAIYGGGWLLHRLLGAGPHPGGVAWALPGITLLVAGAYQWTPLKGRFLGHCSAPGHRSHADGSVDRSARQALLAALHYGKHCVGCCWALMLLMLVMGAGHLGGMAALGAVMAVERWRPWGHRFVVPVGVALFVWGSVTLLSGLMHMGHVHHH